MIQRIKLAVVKLRYKVRLIIAGSRTCKEDPNEVEWALACASQEDTSFQMYPDLVISGKARGGDTAGELWARHEGIPILGMAADWDKHGRKAGYLRNEDMAEVATHCLILRVGGESSKGSTHMINIARNKGLPTYVYEM